MGDCRSEARTKANALGYLAHIEVGQALKLFVALEHLGVRLGYPKAVTTYATHLWSNARRVGVVLGAQPKRSCEQAIADRDSGKNLFRGTLYRPAHTTNGDLAPPQGIGP